MTISRETVLELRNVQKKLGGRPVIRGIDMSLNAAEVFGFLGPNGAGKTTTLRMVVGLIRADAGDIRVCGKSLKEDFVGAMQQVGCMIENPEMYKYMSGWDNLMLAVRMDKRIDRKRIGEVVETVGLSHRIEDKVGTYSLGMKQRLGIAQAILNRPRLLILDEPTNGLDPAGINEFRLLIRRLADEEGMAVLVSSHLLAEVEQVCDRAAIIRQGSIIRTDTMENLLAGRVVVWETEHPETAADILARCDVRVTAREGMKLTGTLGNMPAELVNTQLVTGGCPPRYVVPRTRSLEDLFLELTEGDEIV